MKPGSPLGWLSDRPSSPAEALAWDATRYLLDDLDADAAAAFERRLGGDQAAREALAAAVDLVGAVAVVGAEPALAVYTLPERPHLAARPWRRRGLAAAAAVLLMAAGVAGLRGLIPAGPGRPEAWRVAATWADLHRAISVPSGDPEALANGEAATDAEAEQADAATERPVPSWLVAAVAVVPPDSTVMPDMPDMPTMRDMSEMGDKDETDSLMDKGD